MAMTVESKYVIDSWEEITAISRTERYDFVRGDEHYYSYLPTLEKLEVWMSTNDWDYSPVTENEFLKWITIFHSHYTSNLRK